MDVLVIVMSCNLLALVSSFYNAKLRWTLACVLLLAGVGCILTPSYFISQSWRLSAVHWQAVRANFTENAADERHRLPRLLLSVGRRQSVTAKPIYDPFDDLSPERKKQACIELRPLAPAQYEDTPAGGRQFLDDLVDRQRVLQRCMLLGFRPWRTIRHVCTESMGCGGMADRLRASLHAFFVAALTDRALVVQHHKPPVVHLEDYLEPAGWIDWRIDSLPSDAQHLVTYSKLHSHIDTFPGGCRGLAWFWAELTISVAHLSWNSNIPPLPRCICYLAESVFKMGHGQRAHKLLAHNDRLTLTRTALTKLYRFSPLLKEAYSGLIKQIVPDSFLPKCTVCFHIRSGKNVGRKDFVDSQRLNTNYDDFGRCGKLVSNTYLRPANCTPSITTWLLVMDNNDVPSVMSALQKHASNRTTIRTTASASPIAHLDKYIFTQTQELKAAGLHAFVDFHLIQQCRYVVQSPSGFSMLSSIMAPEPNSVIRHVVPVDRPCEPMDLNRWLFVKDEPLL